MERRSVSEWFNDTDNIIIHIPHLLNYCIYMNLNIAIMITILQFHNCCILNRKYFVILILVILIIILIILSTKIIRYHSDKYNNYIR